MNRRINGNELLNNLTEGTKIIEIDNIYAYFLKEHEKCDYQSDNKKHEKCDYQSDNKKIVYKCGNIEYTEEAFDKRRKDYIDKCRALGLIRKSR